MLTKRELLALIVSFASMNDAALLEDDRGLPPTVCNPDDRPAVRRALRIIQGLRARFSFPESPRFASEVQGRSTAYVTLRATMENEPVKKARHVAAFDAALAAVLSSSEAFELVPAARHPELAVLQSLLRQVANPD